MQHRPTMPLPMKIGQRKEEAYLKTVGINPDDVGALLATGAQNSVHFYEDPETHADRVIKIPLAAVSMKIRERLQSLITAQTPESAEHEKDLAERYFGNYVLPTDIRKSANGKNFVFVQDLLAYDNITKEMIHTDQNIRGQMEEILERNGTLMTDEKLWLDVAGFNWKKFRKFFVTGEPYMENVVRERETGNAKIIDVGLFTQNFHHQLQLMFQRENMKRFGLSFEGSPKKENTHAA
jgi:hypothetical protein